MKPVECPFESDVLTAIFQGVWPEMADVELREHVAHCSICSDVASVAGTISEANEELIANAPVPDASRVWHHAQLRARREAVLAAGRPITAAQVIAFACAMGLLGACFGATSAWFQSALGRVALVLAGVNLAALLASATQALMDHAALILTLVAAVFLIPTIFYVALGRD